MKVVVIGSSNIDMVAQVNHLPAPGETVGDASFMQSLGGICNVHYLFGK